MSDQPKLKIDWIACNGYGVCEAAAPDLIVLDDWGYPVLPDGPVPRDLMREAAKAINDCPMLALGWENKETAAGDRLGRIRGLVPSRRKASS